MSINTARFISRYFQGAMIEPYNKKAGFGTHRGGILQVRYELISIVNMNYVNSLTDTIIISII
jgi:hypothetical protein